VRDLAEGLAVRVAIPLAVSELNRLAQRFELVTEDELALAMREYAAAGIRVEGAAAAPLAAEIRESLPRPAVLIVAGRNIDDPLYERILIDGT
jgi:threonine dehydratase